MVETASPLPSRRADGVILGAVVLAAWIILAVSATTPYGALLDHRQIEEGVVPAFVRWPAFLSGWTLMVLAMMLPGSLPMLRSFLQTAARSDVAPGRGLWSYLPGYLLIWLAFGAAIYLGDTVLHGAIDGGLLPGAVEPLIPVALLAVAGLYQFTPLKRCSGAKTTLAQEHLPAMRGAAFSGGLRAGLLCLGTCGALMVVMFALGGGISLPWMAALTALTLLERTTKYGRYVAWPLGVTLILWAALKLAG